MQINLSPEHEKVFKFLSENTPINQDQIAQLIINFGITFISLTVADKDKEYIEHYKEKYRNNKEMDHFFQMVYVAFQNRNLKENHENDEK